MIQEKFQIGEQTVTFETGHIAKQAQGSCVVRVGDTVVLVTACGTQEPRPGIDFLPLSVDYVEKYYAAGRIPGGFFKREGRLRDAEVLVSRLIDRPCRPLFPEGYRNEIQVIATVLSADKSNPSDVLALIGASAALHLSPIPWAGPIGGVRVGRINGQFVANPTFEQLEESDCDLIIAASKDAIVMVEGESEELTEEEMVEALFFGHGAAQAAISAIEKLKAKAGAEKWSFAASALSDDLRKQVHQAAEKRVLEACNIADKHERYAAFKQVKRDLIEKLATGDDKLDRAAQVSMLFEDLRYDTMRSQILDQHRRVDGRDTTTVRPITVDIGWLPRTHGSAVFTRGETQAIVTTTLGTGQDEQRIEGLVDQYTKRFMLHYNFPPFSVGEVKPLRGAGRREVGHGNLAERALERLLPPKESFPYTIRIVSEVTESNGSSSMASVCGGSLALMDAGVPVKAACAGVAMGLIKESEKWAVLTDILGDEDHLGDMDFKVCGTSKGITAIQMDIKISGLSREILSKALEQARVARLHILEKMTQALPEARSEVSMYAPRIETIRIKPDQVRVLIGPGGKTIRGIIDQTGVTIDVTDDGQVLVGSPDGEALKKAVSMIELIMAEPEVGKRYQGTVKRIEPYGAFLEVLPGQDGLLHISDFDWKRIEKVEDIVQMGETMEVMITNVDRDGKIRLSRKELLPKPEGYVEPPPRPQGDRDRGPRRGGDRGPRRGGGGSGERSRW